ncbi:MAG: helix-turn-helix-type transcriptional regulator, partial [Saprospiraceae bacterium]|nr:helix-turn-helix-type transcriptional regulator [Saprospiraceae bacterium]
DGELQELTLLFVHYLLRKRGQRVVYLGQGNSIGDLRDACQAVRPDYVFTILQEPLPRQSIQSYVDQIAQLLPGGRLLVTGAQVFIGPLKLPDNVRVLNGLPDTMQFLDTLQIRQISAR